ncbi:deoxyribonuclease IV [soil metagenome]
MRVGSHVSARNPLASAAAEGADCVQLFLGNPQSWRAPKPREDAQRLRRADLPLYVHAPYLINVASPNNRVRVPSRRILQQTCDAAAAVGAAAVVVHGGSVAGDGGKDAGFARWRKALRVLETDVPLLLENTAGGEHALAREPETVARLWDHAGDLGLGFCFDTCHAHVSGHALPEALDRFRAVTGRVDLLHCNDAKDDLGSGRDRHEHLGEGRIDPAALVETVRRAGAPVICETPDEGRRRDLAWLRRRLGQAAATGDRTGG